MQGLTGNIGACWGESNTAGEPMGTETRYQWETGKEILRRRGNNESVNDYIQQS